MKPEEYNDLLLFKNMQGSGLLPVNQNAFDLLDLLKKDEVVAFKNVTQRDLNLHKCYFAFLSEVYGYLPKKFKDKVEKDNFYEWLKIYQGKYTLLFSFKSGAQQIKTESISFSRMNNQRFRAYVLEQIPEIYQLFKELLPDAYADSAIETLEEHFLAMFNKL